MRAGLVRLLVLRPGALQGVKEEQVSACGT
jgi:hypothetical protein